MYLRLVVGVCLALKFTAKRVREIVVGSAVLLVCLAVLAPSASGKQCGYNAPNLSADSIYNGGPSPDADYHQNVGNCDLLEFGRNDVSGNVSSSNSASESGSTSENKPEEDSSYQPASARLRWPDFNRDIYYKNKLEFSQDIGWLPINIPFPFDFMLSDQYELYPLKYTLVPMIGSLRWQIGDIKGPLFLRGNWDAEASLAVVAIPRGPETHYFTYIMGMRRNFVPRNWKVTPYFDWRAGLGYINAKGPLGVAYAQGQDFTFTLNMGSGLRYNFSPRYAVTVGLNWMHISNANLSEHKYDPNQPNPWGFINYGINVYGPMVGVDIQLRKQRRHSE